MNIQKESPEKTANPDTNIAASTSVDWITPYYPFDTTSLQQVQSAHGRVVCLGTSWIKQDNDINSTGLWVIAASNSLLH